MNAFSSRREFLSQVGKGVLAATLSPAVAVELGLAPSGLAAETDSQALRFGEIEPLVAFLQDTPVGSLQPALMKKLGEGIGLKKLVAAGALANARTFGGEDYVGFHTIMALGPALAMAEDSPQDRAALPVFKVLYRNTNRIQEKGGRKAEAMSQRVQAGANSGDPAAALLAQVRQKNTAEAERILAAQPTAEDMLAALLPTVCQDQEVHRTVLPYRAWDLLPVVGREHADTLLRQSLRYCVRAESWRSPDWEKPALLLAKLLDEYKLPRASTRKADDAFVEELSRAIFGGTPEQAATAAAAALGEGMDPASVGEAVSLAANQLLLRDHGRRPSDEVAGKPVGSVHGDSIGVHASDSANAWRNLARVSTGRNAAACLVLGAWQAAEDRTNRGGDFAKWDPLPLPRHLDEAKPAEPAQMLGALEEAVRGNLQARACALVHRWGLLGHPEKPVFDLLLRFAVSEDGALHAEKFYRTVREEFASTRAAFRWRHLAALARVTASEHGKPAAGQAEARALLGVS